MMLPDAALSLTIPSIHDNTVLDCRIYHPQALSANPRAPAWQRHAAILAHPYAPLGGCFDDPVLAEVTGQLLRSGFLVATFNFRGAGESAGRTSWTGKPECDDYMSVIGFVVYYTHFLDPFRHTHSDSSNLLLPSATPATKMRPPNLIIGGYSYGSIITTQIPPLDAILEHFDSPVTARAAAQIRLRAQHLAAQYNDVLGNAREAMLSRRSKSYGSTSLRVGGDEEPGSPRRSSDGERRSFSMEAEERVRSLFRRHKDRADGNDHMQPSTASSGEALVDERLSSLSDLTIPKPSYLLISPVQGVMKHLALMDFWTSTSLRSQSSLCLLGEAKLVQHPTLAVYGNRDVFVAANKLRAWSAKLSSQEGSRFRAVEVDQGGHFWVEHGVLLQLKSAVGSFAASLLTET